MCTSTLLSTAPAPERGDCDECRTARVLIDAYPEYEDIEQLTAARRFAGIARGYVRRYWLKIERMAERLLADGAISGDEAHAIAVLLPDPLAPIASCCTGSEPSRPSAVLSMQAPSQPLNSGLEHEHRPVRRDYLDRLRARHAQTHSFRVELMERLARAYGVEADQLEQRVREIELDLGLSEGRIVKAAGGA